MINFLIGFLTFFGVVFFFSVAFFIGMIVARRFLKEEFRKKECLGGCGFQEPYGFVPEADCPIHDIKEFLDILEKAETRKVNKLVEKINDIIAEFGDNPEFCLNIIDENLNGKKEQLF